MKKLIDQVQCLAPAAPPARLFCTYESIESIVNRIAFLSASGLSTIAAIVEGDKVAESATFCNISEGLNVGCNIAYDDATRIAHY